MSQKFEESEVGVPYTFVAGLVTRHLWWVSALVTVPYPAIFEVIQWYLLPPTQM